MIKDVWKSQVSLFGLSILSALSLPYSTPYHYFTLFSTFKKIIILRVEEQPRFQRSKQWSKSMKFCMWRLLYESIRMIAEAVNADKETVRKILLNKLNKKEISLDFVLILSWYIFLLPIIQSKCVIYQSSVR